MSAAEAFFDTNVLLYMLCADAAKADRAERLIAGGGVVSAQVLNEFAAVASRKNAMQWREIVDVLNIVRAVCRVEAIDAKTHDDAVALADRYGLTIYDACIAASALNAGCRTLYSEDFQAGQVFGRSLTVRNPFASSPRGATGRARSSSRKH